MNRKGLLFLSVLGIVLLTLALAIHLSLAQNRRQVKSWGTNFVVYHCPFARDRDGTGATRSCSASVPWKESIVIGIPSEADYVFTRRDGTLGYLWQCAQSGASVNISGSWSWRIMDKLN